MNGLTLQVTIGTFGGFYIGFTKLSWRICLGWLAITLFFVDIEQVMVSCLKEKERKGEEKK